MKLSLCIIVKNEETSLPSCLSSIKDVVDEIVLLDTGSTDRTPEIAREFGARVYHFEWVNDFSAARNEALKYVRGDWILVLDADEVLTPEIVPQIKKVIHQESYILINLVRQEVGASQSPYSLVSRLFRYHPAIHFSRPYHAMVDDSVAQLLQQETDWQVGYLSDVAILHHGYQKSAIASRQKFAKAQATMEQFLTIHPSDPYLCSKLGALYVEAGEVLLGIELLERGLAAELGNAEILYELHYHLGIAYGKVSNVTKAQFHYQAATQQPILPKLQLGAYNNLGNLLKASCQMEAAKIAYETALKIDANFAMGHYNLGMVLKELGYLEEAIAAYQQAIYFNPEYAEAYQNLGVILLNKGKVIEGLVALRKAISLHDKSNPSEAERLRQGLKEMGFNLSKKCQPP